MKKSFVVILIVAVLFGVFAVCCFNGNGQVAHAEDNDLSGDNYDNEYGSIFELTAGTDFYGDAVAFQVGNTWARLYVYSVKGKPIGVRFRGTFFGDSNIEVVADVYSSNALKIDFKITEKKDKLTAKQVETRNVLLKLFNEISLMIEKVDECANANYDGTDTRHGKSDIYNYNSAEYGKTVEISDYTYDMLTYARTMYDATDHAFNPAVYRLVDLWGFSSRVYSYGRVGEQPYDIADSSKLPAQKYVDAFSNEAFIDFSQDAVQLSKSDDGKYYVTKNVAPAVVDGVEFQQWLDLGGVAKGYAVDLARKMIRELGIENFYVNAGSSSIATGYEHDGGKTELGMLDAFDPEAEFYQTALFSVKIGKSSISTSGQNIRKYTVDGVEYAHILDGKTGEPAQTGVKSVMVVVPEEEGEYWATMGDCLTTALTVMGRDKIVEFANGYLKEHNIKIVVQYETLDGRKQLLSNYDESDLTPISDSYSEFGWALKLENGVYYYDPDAKFTKPTDTYTVLIAVLASVLGAGAIALIVYHFVRGKKRIVANVVNAKKDKPFKVLDVMMYIAVALLILVLFYVFIFDTDSSQMQIVTVVDESNGEILFVYNVTRNEFTVNDNNSNGWKIDVDKLDDGIVTLSRDISGEKHFNTLKITRGRNPSVEMIDSLCGYHQDCVRNFSAITRSGGAIVCSPNRLKVVTS